MKPAFCGVLLAALAVLLAWPSNANADLVINGNFSSNASSYVSWPGYNGTTNPSSPTGWVANVNPSLSGINGPDAPGPSGYAAYPNPFGPYFQSVDNLGNSIRDYMFLQGSGTSESQSINFLPHTQYRFSFDAASRNLYGNAYIAVVVNDGSGANPYDPVGVVYSNVALNPFGLGNYKWTFKSLNFWTGTNAKVGSLSFINDSIPGPDRTVDVANVSITAISVPEPSSFVLLAIGGIGLAIGAYRRWQMTAV